MTHLHVEYVTVEELRRRFNDGNYYARALDGVFRREMLYNGHPSAKRSGMPHCTRSQIYAYWDEYGHKVAVMHQYRLKDGSLSGGRPDLKDLVEDGVI